MHASILGRMLRLRIGGRSPIATFVRLNERLWSFLPPPFTARVSIRSYGTVLHAMARLSAIRRQNGSTYFFRNRPELELIRRLVDKKGRGSSLKISVLGCSTGAELYSIMWTIRSARPDLRVSMHAVDISREAVEGSRQGVYSASTPQLVGGNIFERMSEEERQQMFDREGVEVRIKSEFKEGIIWHQRDVRDQQLVNILGPQDIVVANRFLCHMDPPDADECLRNIARLVRPGGYLFVSGIDLDIRTKVAHDLGWEPVRELLEEIHDGDPSLRNSWPWGYWGLEPLNKKKRGWRVHYASVFRVRVGLWLFELLPSNLSWNPESRIDFMDLVGTLVRF